MTNTTTGNTTAPDVRSYYEALTPEALRYNGLSKCFYVDDLYTMTLEEAKAFHRRLKGLIISAEVDPDVCSDDPRNGYLYQGRRRLNPDEVRKLEDGDIAIGSAYAITPEEAHAVGMDLLDLSFDYSAVPDDSYGQYLLQHINPVIHALEGNALAFLPTEVQPALLDLKALLTEGDYSAEKDTVDQDKGTLGHWRLEIIALREGIVCRANMCQEPAIGDNDHKSVVYMRLLADSVCKCVEAKSGSMADLMGAMRHEGCDDPQCLVCSKYHRD